MTPTFNTHEPRWWQETQADGNTTATLRCKRCGAVLVHIPTMPKPLPTSKWYLDYAQAYAGTLCEEPQKKGPPFRPADAGAPEQIRTADSGAPSRDRDRERSRHEDPTPQGGLFDSPPTKEPKP